ncbi:MAG TPA: hypothetical protein VGM06_23980 [Polyangiaceae bacterium]|jgi:hypothetical protein
MSCDAVVATFAAYGLALTQTARATAKPRSIAAFAQDTGIEPPTLGAMVSFAGPRVRGDLLLASSMDVVTQTRPGSGKRFSKLQTAAKLVMMRDWMGELANQALGRVKSALLGLNLAFETRSPIPLSAEAMTLVTPKSPDTRPVFFRGGGGDVGFWLDVLHDGEIDTDVGTGGGSGNIKEGKLVLF